MVGEIVSCGGVPATFEEWVRKLVDTSLSGGFPSRQEPREEDDDIGMCAYRGAGGARCAIGLLISDEKYSPDMEGCGPGSENVHQALPGWARDIQECNRFENSVLNFAQRCHDDEAAKTEWSHTRFVLSLARRSEFAAVLEAIAPNTGETK